jgi:O-antigen/teichoic acid export membrane protein
MVADMATNSTNYKRIAKNTMYMYFRMLFVMAVSIYTSRVILQSLGVTDYGLYNVVGGVVGLLSFVNDTLSQGTSRFLMFELGAGDKKKLKDTFSTLLTTHIILALIIVLIAETAGLWFVYNKLNVPSSRMNAAVVVYHISILTAFFSLTQAPYSASIKSHERMDIYAYTSIVDVTAKLGIVYLLSISPMDRLVFYAILLCVEQVGMIIFYRFFCVAHFFETKYKYTFDKAILKQVLGYTSWNFFSNVSTVLNTQGMTILINMFFAPAVVASLAIANTVKNAALSFVQNFRLASIPQIVKQYAAGNHDESQKLLMLTTRYSFFLLYFLCLPIYLCAYEVLKLWLGQVPPYSVIFLRYVILICIFDLFVSCFFTALDVLARIKEYSIIFPLIMILCFPFVYLLFRLGFSPVTVTAVLLASYIILGVIALPILIVRIAKYNYRDIFNLFKICILVVMVSLPIPVMCNYYLTGQGVLARFVITGIACIISVLFSAWVIGVNKQEKKKIKSIVRSKFSL